MIGSSCSQRKGYVHKKRSNELAYENKYVFHYDLFENNQMTPSQTLK